MRNSKLAHGERRFSRKEWLSKAQIRSFFSRIRAAGRKQAVLQSERQIDVDSEDDFGCMKSNYLIKPLKKMNLGIKLWTKSMCDILWFTISTIYVNYQLTKFNVTMLKEICNYLEIQVKYRDTKMVILD
ncbi:hypothetical protein P5673_012293 [Acropora cervicornis]|uniref:Uncharacterized protein n=1 Tax=Acropora cervicornis TaxID=6130 RepID=A0AAD9QMP4_ACRCE|nr:hypothetical protein P5673_012293 [Acropora cervicornis]